MKYNFVITLYKLIFTHRKLYPDLKENLEQFRAHLKESAHEMAPLKVWQLQGMRSFIKIRPQI